MPSIVILSTVIPPSASTVEAVTEVAVSAPTLAVPRTSKETPVVCVGSPIMTLPLLPATERMTTLAGVPRLTPVAIGAVLAATPNQL